MAIFDKCQGSFRDKKRYELKDFGENLTRNFDLSFLPLLASPYELMLKEQLI